MYSATVIRLIKNAAAVKMSPVHQCPDAKPPVSESTEETTGVAQEIDQSGLDPAAMAAIGAIVGGSAVAVGRPSPSQSKPPGPNGRA